MGNTTETRPTDNQDLAKSRSDFLELVLADLIPVIFTLSLTILSWLIKNNLIPLLASVQKSLQEMGDTEGNCAPKLSPPCEAEVKDLTWQILKESGFNRISLYFVEHPKFSNDRKVIHAQTYRLWLEVCSRLTPMRKDFTLSFALVSKEINGLTAENEQCRYYAHASKGDISPVWLRDRKTKSYLIYLISLEKGLGFILCEQTKWVFGCHKKDDVMDLCSSINAIFQGA